MADAESETSRYGINLSSCFVYLMKISEVLLKMGSIGICGSDIHMWEDARNGKAPIEAKLVFGKYENHISAAN